MDCSTIGRAEPNCEEHSDCARSLRCINGDCVVGDCDGPNDCPDGYYCDEFGFCSERSGPIGPGGLSDRAKAALGLAVVGGAYYYYTER